MTAAQDGDKVTIHYTGTFENGKEFDSTHIEGGRPITFILGSGDVILAINQAVLGMQVGEKKKIVAKPEEAFGDYDPELVVVIPRDTLPEGVKIGSLLQDSEYGYEWEVVDLKREKAKLDANHGLAGKTLHYEIEVIQIEKMENL